MKRSAKLIAILRVAPYRAALLRYGVAAAVEHREALGSLDPGPWSTTARIAANSPFSPCMLFQTRGSSRSNLLNAPATRFRRLFANGPRVTFHNAALAPESGQSTMRVSRHDDSSSLLPITATQARLFQGTDAVRTETVRTGPLSDFIEDSSIDDPALLKLDVQGYELGALRARVRRVARQVRIRLRRGFIHRVIRRPGARRRAGRLAATSRLRACPDLWCRQRRTRANHPGRHDVQAGAERPSRHLSDDGAVAIGGGPTDVAPVPCEKWCRSW